jgi:hypothetical protein
MQNQIFEGGKAAVASINVSPEPAPDVVEALVGIDEVFNVVAVPPAP